MKPFKTYRFLLLRRAIQLGLLFLYCMGNYAGWTILRGNLSSSRVVETIPLSDPFATLQIFFAGSLLALDVIVGALIILGFYALFAGRAFCSYVCPVNLIVDLANYLRRVGNLNALHRGILIQRGTRYWILGIALVLSFVLGLPAFELISPIGVLHREIVFGMGVGMTLIFGLFLFDLLVLKNGFCGYLCPLGAFYSLASRYAILRVKYDRESCTLCMKCKEVCPEKQVLEPIGNQSGWISNSECLNCGRCIEVCGDNSLSFGIKSFIEFK